MCNSIGKTTHLLAEVNAMTPREIAAAVKRLERKWRKLQEKAPTPEDEGEAPTRAGVLGSAGSPTRSPLWKAVQHWRGA